MENLTQKCEHIVHNTPQSTIFLLQYEIYDCLRCVYDCVCCVNMMSVCCVLIKIIHGTTHCSFCKGEFQTGRATGFPGPRLCELSSLCQSIPHTWKYNGMIFASPEKKIINHDNYLNLFRPVEISSTDIKLQ